MIIDTTNDENAVLTLGSNVTVDGISLNKLYYNYLNGELKLTMLMLYVILGKPLILQHGMQMVGRPI